jgi:hypothetical protein
MMLDLWLYQSTIDVSPTRVVVQGGWLGVGRREEVSTGDVLKLEAVQGMTSNSRVFYNLVLVRSSGKRIRFAKRIQGNWAAKGVIRVIEEAMGRTA